MNKKQILVVEDEGLIAKDLQMMLRRLGYDVPTTVGTGELAIQTVIKNSPDLILMDIQLRGNMDGVQAAEAIRSVQDTPIVFLTANSDELNFQRAKLTDPFAFLIKPFEERGLQAAIEMALYKSKTEKHIREREQLLSTTMRSIADGVITTDEAGSLTFLNTVAEKLLGWTNEESLGKHYTEVFCLKEETSPDGAEEKASATGAMNGIRVNHTLLTPRIGIDIHIEYSAAQIRKNDDCISGYVIVFSDVTQQRKLEEAIRHSQKIEVIGKLAASIAHDFNNALTAIMGYSSLMLAKLPAGGALYNDAGQLMHAAEHSARLTRQLLAFSRKQILRPIRLNLGIAINEMHGLLRRLIRENIALSIHVPEDLWDISADPGNCEQLVLNMAVNARDAMPHGGRLDIELANAFLTPEAAAGIRMGREGEFVTIRIIDTGTGISREDIDRIFEPFFTTKGRDRGTGLGLSTCEGIVTQGGGFIDVSSILGAGTSFTVYFPRTTMPGAQNQTSGPGTAAVARGTESILLVEDEEAVRVLAARVLEELGYTVMQAQDGLEALKALKERHDKVDLVITDLVMPSMSGLELAERIQELHCIPKIVLISGYTNDDLASDPLLMEKLAFLQKPFSPDSLARKVREVLDSDTGVQGIPDV